MVNKYWFHFFEWFCRAVVNTEMCFIGASPDITRQRCAALFKNEMVTQINGRCLRSKFWLILVNLTYTFCFKPTMYEVLVSF